MLEPPHSARILRDTQKAFHLCGNYECMIRCFTHDTTLVRYQHWGIVIYLNNQKNKKRKNIDCSEAKSRMDPGEAVPNFECPNCGRMTVLRGRFYYREGLTGNFMTIYKYKCANCGHLFGETEKTLLEWLDDDKKRRILLSRNRSGVL